MVMQSVSAKIHQIRVQINGAIAGFPRLPASISLAASFFFYTLHFEEIRKWFPALLAPVITR